MLVDQPTYSKSTYIFKMVVQCVLYVWMDLATEELRVDMDENPAAANGGFSQQPPQKNYDWRVRHGSSLSRHRK